MSLLFLLIQYLQSKIQWFVISILSKEIHLPSLLKVWHIPEATLLPSNPPFPFLSTPLEVQATSYLAASDSISSFLKISSLEHMFIINKLYTNICSCVNSGFLWIFKAVFSSQIFIQKRSYSDMISGSFPSL